MGNHTPTPWEVLDTHFGPKIYTVQGNGAAVCQFFPFHEKGRNPTDAFLNADANAALIVRAVNAHAQLIADVAEWKQAAAVEAGLRREFYDKNAKLSAALNKVNDWLVCHAIASDEDMAQSFPTMCEIVNDALASLKETAS